MNTNKKVVNNFLWRFLERCGAQGVTLLVSIILARLLDPSDYGTVALVTVITSILQVFIDSGLGTALIQKKETDDLDFSSVFYFNILMCVLLYIVMFLAAPLIASFYEKPELIPLVRVVSLSLIISGVKNIQQAYVSRHLLFKRFFFATLSGTIGAAGLGIWMAYKGYGAWAIVAQNLFNKTVDTIILWITVRWRPQRKFSFERLKSLLQYGWKLLVSSLLDKTYAELRQLIIGKMYSSADLAYYNKGQHFPGAIVNNVNTSIDSVLLPVMSQAQDNKQHIRSMTRRSIRISTFIMAPLMMGLAAVAPVLIKVLLTEKWMKSVLFLQIFCITYMFQPIQTANMNAIKAMGRSDLFLKLDVIKKIFGFVILFSTIWFGVEMIAYSLLLTSLVNQLINSWPNKKLLGYGYVQQIKDVMPTLALSILTGVLVYLLQYIPFPDALKLIVQVITGVAFFITCCKLCKMESYVYVKKILTSHFLKKKGSPIHP